MACRWLVAATLSTQVACLVTIDRGRIGRDAGSDASSPTPTVVASTKAEAGASQPLVLTIPSGTQPGDLLIAAFTMTTNQTISTPAGWSTVLSASNPQGATLLSVAFSHVAQPGDPASVTWTPTASGGAVGGIVTIRGADSNDPIEAKDGQYTGDQQRFSTPTLTVAGPVLLVGIFSSNGARGLTVDLPFVEVFQNARAFCCEIQLTQLAWSNAGQTPSATTTATLEPNSSNFGQMIAIRPKDR